MHGAHRLLLQVGVATLAAGCGGTLGTAPLDGGAPDLTAAAVTADLVMTPTGDGATPPDLSGAPIGGGLFSKPGPWNTDVSKAPLDAESQTVIAGLAAAGGWGSGKFQIDFSLLVLTADNSTPMKDFVASPDFFQTDCDATRMPVPVGGAIEGESGYACNGDSDCHLLVVVPAQRKLYEMWRAFAPPNPNVFNGGCSVVWDLDKAYPPNLRGDGCTSADAGGFPMASMLVTSDEVAAAIQKGGSSDAGHAMRFALPNPRIRRHTYVHPGTHTTDPTNGGPGTPPYGAHFRLRPDFPVASLPSEAARVIARTLMKYGMFLADGGQIPLMIADDRFSKNKWADMNLDSHSLFAIAVGDFQMLDGGTRYTTMDCTRNP